MAKSEQPYFTDYEFLNRWNRDQENILLHGNKTLKAYESIMGFKIDSISDFSEMLNDPESYYREQYYQANKMDFQLLEKLNLDLTELIKIPKDFIEFESIASRFKRELGKNDFKFYTIKNGRFVHSDLAIQRRDQKSIFFAYSSEEKARLSLAEKLIGYYNDLAKQMQRELKPGRYQTMIEGLFHCKPLPQLVIIAPDENGKAKLWPSPKFIRDSFKGTSLLGTYWPTDFEIERAQKDLERIEARRSKAVEETILISPINQSPNSEALNFVLSK
jgi:hypothetical protein